MKPRFLLDTNILSEPLRPEPDPGVLERLEKNESSCAISAPVWHELTYGAELLPDSQRRRRIETYLQEVVRPSFPILPHDDAAAAAHAADRAWLKSEGLTAPFVDGQIAAIARVNKLVLVTSNTKDFENFPDLELEDWRSGASERAR